MGVSLTVVTYEKISQCFNEKRDFRVEKQAEIQDSLEETMGLGHTKTEIKFNKTDDEQLGIYSVKMNSKIIKEPIFIYWNDIEEGQSEIKEVNEYQKVQDFTFKINFNSNKIYIFAPKDVVLEFLRRVKREARLQPKMILFDFTKITELEKLSSAWGVWEDGEGRVRRQASFGNGLEEDIQSFDKITTIYMDYEYAGDIIQLIVSKEGRISTRSKDIQEEDILIIFNELSKVLGDAN